MKTNRYFYCGLVLSSLDSFPLFSSISTYSPYLSVIFFAIYYITTSKNILNFKFTKNNFIILIIILFALIYSLYNGLFIYYDIGGFTIFSVQLLIAIILYKSFNCYFKNLPKIDYIKTFAQNFIKFSIPIIIIGLIEILFFPFKNIYSSLLSIIEWRVTMERIQLVSGEPAWATRFLLTFIALIPLAKFSRKKHITLTLISLLLLFATGSTLGIICVGIYYGITYFNKQYIKYYALVFIIFLMIAPTLYNNLNNYTKERIELLCQLNSTDIETLAVSAGSGSVMARLGNPILASYMGIDNLIFGVGGGYYYYHHYDYLEKYFPKALNIKNVYETGTTAKNLFARIFAETGIIGLGVLIWILIWIYKFKVRNNIFLCGIFTAMLLLTLNFDNLFHIYPLLLFCFLLNIPYTIKHK